MPFQHDLILRGGRVIDPSQGLDSIQDVAFKDGKVSALGQQITTDSSNVIDVSNHIITPGFIDMHGHFAYGLQPRSAHPDLHGLATGVTTCVDAGSTGWIYFPALKRYVIESMDARMFAFIHLSSLGLVTQTTIQIPDLEDFRLAREEETIQQIEKNRDVVPGVKVRLTPTGTTAKNAVAAMEMARRVADKTNSKIMVHVMESPLPLAEVFSYLRPGDIATHIFHGDTHGVLDSKGEIRPECWDAYNQGIIFDTAGAQRHFSLDVEQAVVSQGMLPHTISTDRNTPRPGDSNYTLHDHMSMFLGMGVSISKVLEAVTSKPASVLGRDDLGTLKIGAIGDAAVTSLVDGDFGFEDGLGNSMRTDRIFTPVLTIKGGKHWQPRIQVPLSE